MSSSKFSSDSIRIDGNGNAVGNGNRVTYVKKTIINNNNGSGSGDDGKGQDAGGALAILGFVGGAVALAALSFWFTRYSAVIYGTLIFFSFTNGAFGVMAALKQFYDDDYLEALRSFSLAAIALLTYLSVGAASDTMPTDLAEFSKIGTFNSFWCGLNLFGQQVASQHSIIGTFIMVPLAVLTGLQTWRSATLAMCDAEELPEWAQTVLESAAGWRQFIAICVICVLCVAGHSRAGDQFWKDHFNSRISFICPSK
ncbi:hypothetical protein ACL58G_04580 [Massilia sp. GER05]|uniref:hypothetical protein n=1 Tax=Massilia sp. GER05 TaxID=3394605 RepID=UPI003F869944